MNWGLLTNFQIIPYGALQKQSFPLNLFTWIQFNYSMNPDVPQMFQGEHLWPTTSWRLKNPAHLTALCSSIEDVQRSSAQTVESASESSLSCWKTLYVDMSIDGAKYRPIPEEQLVVSVNDIRPGWKYTFKEENDSKPTASAMMD